VNQQDKAYIKYFLLFFGIAAIVIVGALIAIDDTDDFKSLNLETEINDRVVNVGEKAAHSVRYIEFEKGQKISISKGTINFKYDPTDLIYFLMASDRVNKKAGSDTILITRTHFSIRNRTEHVFLLNQKLNVELDSGQIF
jgi:hypothetical protein